MKFRVPHKLRRSYTRFFIFLQETFNPMDYSNPKLDTSQKRALSICIKMINNPQSELLTSLASEKRYIKNGDYFIVISLDSIKIVNHVYSYDIKIHGKKIKNLKNLFDSKVDSIRLKMEEDILKNVIHSLEDISKKIREELN